MLSAQGIAHTYGAHEALRGVDLDVQPGEIVALLGPNGAGKSTLLQVLAGLLRPTGGHADVAGVRVPGDVRKLGRVVGFVPQGESLYPELTVRETLKFFAGMHGAPTTDAAITRGLARVSLAHRADTRVGELSGGLRQRLALAASLAHEPRVLLLDEPGTGLDPSARARLATMLRAVRDDKRAVLLSTHSLDEAARVADRVVFLVAGRVESTLAGRDAQRLEARFRELEVDA